MIGDYDERLSALGKDGRPVQHRSEAGAQHRAGHQQQNRRAPPWRPPLRALQSQVRLGKQPHGLDLTGTPTIPRRLASVGGSRGLR